MTSPAPGPFRLRWWWYAVAGVAGALPSLVWAFNGAGLLHDDWGHIASSRFNGVWDATVNWSIHGPARPLTGLYYAISYGVFGTNAAALAVLQALLNGAAAALVLAVSWRLLGPRVGPWVAATWIVLPNRGSTRLWVAMAPEVLAVCLLLIGILLLLHDRPVLAGTAMAAGVLAYESVVAVSVAAIAVWAWHHRERVQLQLAGLAASQVVLAALTILSLSPKRTDEAPFARWTTVFAAHWGRGVLGDLALLAEVIMLAVAVAFAKGVLPGFRHLFNERDRLVLAGVAVAFLGALPFFPSGFPFATDGILDRANLVAGLGTSLTCGALLAWVFSRQAAVGLVVGALLLGYVGSLNRVDLRDYRQAVKDGEELQRQLAVDVPVIDRPMVVGPELPNRGGVAQFIDYGDIGSALAMTRHDPTIEARMALSASNFRNALEPLRYDWVLRRLTTRP